MSPLSCAPGEHFITSFLLCCMDQRTPITSFNCQQGQGLTWHSENVSFSWNGLSMIPILKISDDIFSDASGMYGCGNLGHQSIHPAEVVCKCMELRYFGQGAHPSCHSL